MRDLEGKACLFPLQKESVWARYGCVRRDGEEREAMKSWLQSERVPLGLTCRSRVAEVEQFRAFGEVVLDD